MGNLALAMARENGLESDPFGAAMGILFPLAECIRAATGEIVSGYSPSPLAPLSTPAEYDWDWNTTELWTDYLLSTNDRAAEIVEEWQYAFTVLTRYVNFVKLAGKDY